MPNEPTGVVTEILALAQEGNETSRDAAKDQLFGILYTELKRISSRKMAHERDDHTLQPTALVHEAYIRLADGNLAASNRGMFLGVAAKAMGRVLIDHARDRNALKRGRGWKKVNPTVSLADLNSEVDLLELEEILERLGRYDPRVKEMVMMRYLAGMTVPEVAVALNVGKTTIDKWWSIARKLVSRDERNENSHQ